MNRTQHYSLLKAMEIDKSNLLKYQELYKYAYILSDGIFKIVFAEEKDHMLLISLVNAMLNLQGADAIKDITFGGVLTDVYQRVMTTEQVEMHID